MSEAIRRGADYVFLLNNDTWVDPECFDQLIEVAEQHPQAGILSPRICYYSNPELIWYDGRFLNKVDGFWKHAHIHEDWLVRDVVGKIEEVDYISGCAMLIRRQGIKKIGCLDPRFFMYWGDVDYSLRAKKKWVSTSPGAYFLSSS